MAVIDATYAMVIMKPLGLCRKHVSVGRGARHCTSTATPNSEQQEHLIRLVSQLGCPHHHTFINAREGSSPSTLLRSRDFMWSASCRGSHVSTRKCCQRHASAVTNRLLVRSHQLQKGDHGLRFDDDFAWFGAVSSYVRNVSGHGLQAYRPVCRGLDGTAHLTRPCGSYNCGT